MANKFSKSILNDIRDRISIVALIGERVPLKRAGRNFKGCCPFHNEKTPSFNVSDEKGIFHCFGCSEGGDIFQFVMKFDGMGFSEAVKYLAGRAGIELPNDYDPAAKAAEDENSRRKRYCLRINEIARDYFVSRLLDERAGAAARQYLQLRGISSEFFTQLFLGFADNGWDALENHLKAKGAPLDIAVELGLLKKRDSGGCYDFFRNRIMFPVISPRGEVLAFSGRDIGGESEAAKYLNSPDSVVYHKSNCVFGLNIAQAAIRNLDSVVLVEGNLDLVSLHQAGIANVVAPLGTALTAGHVRLLRRYTRNQTVLFDGDAAGVKAALRSLAIFIEEGLSPRVVRLPAGEDPDSLVRKEGAEAFKLRIERASSLFEYFVDQTIVETGSDASGRVNAIGQIVPLLKAVTDPAERGIYTRYVSRKLDVDERSIERSVAGGAKAIAHIASQKSSETPVKVKSGTACVALADSASLSAERVIVEQLLANPESAKDILAEIYPEAFEDTWCRTVAEAVSDHMKREGTLKTQELIEGIADTELADQMRQISMDTDRCSADEVGELVKDCIARIKERPIRARIERINDDIKSAEAEGNDEKLIRLMTEKRELSVQVRRGI